MDLLYIEDLNQEKSLKMTHSKVMTMRKKQGLVDGKIHPVPFHIQIKMTTILKVKMINQQQMKDLKFGVVARF